MNAAVQRYFLLTLRVFVYADTTTVRVLLAWSSLGWCVGLWLPLHTFARPGFVWMRAAMPEWVWGTLFLAHFLGVMWRVYERRDRPYWALAINSLGFVLWTSATLMLTLAVGEYTPGAALEWVMCIAAGVALIRTGHNLEVVSS